MSPDNKNPEMYQIPVTNSEALSAAMENKQVFAEAIHTGTNPEATTRVIEVEGTPGVEQLIDVRHSKIQAELGGAAVERANGSTEIAA